MTDTGLDPFTRRLLRECPAIQAGGAPSQHDVLATYRSKTGVAIFAFCRDGLLLTPGPDERYVPYIDINNAGYYDRAMSERAKAALRSGELAPLTIRLVSGEAIDIALERRGEKIPDLLTIAKLIHQRVVIKRAEQVKR